MSFNRLKQRFLDPSVDEPDLIPSFRYFSYLWLALMLWMFGLPLIAPQSFGSSWLNFLLYAGHALLLAVYLTVAPLRATLGSYYLPLALVFTIAGTGLIELLGSSMGTGNPEDAAFVLLIIPIMRLVLLWIMVMIMTGWSYRLPIVLLSAVGITGLQFLSFILSNTVRVPYLWWVALLLLFVTLALATVGILVWQLSNAERRKRRALAAAHAQLAEYSSTLEQLTVSRERNRIARELHDTVAHTLSGLAVQLETAQLYWEIDPTVSQRLLAESVTAVHGGLHETRRALQALRAGPLEDLGLILALEQLAESAQERAGLQLKLDLPDAAALPLPIEQCIYRVAQEAINNVVRHASARLLKVRLTIGSSILLTVEDDGVGFTPAADFSEGHYGLRGMQERANLVNGQIRVDSQVGAGVAVRLTIPRIVQQ